MDFRWIPNAITGVRMALAAPLAWLILDGERGAALALALAAGLSDAVDGLLAKRMGWQSRLGGLIDPMADKLMLLAAFLSLGLIGEVPAWLVWLVVGRDVVIVAGAIAYHNLIGPLEARPSAISKLTTLLQILLVLALLIDGLDAVALPEAMILGLTIATAITTVASGLHYVYTWSGKTRRALAERRKSPA
jgi:cardiolipin synthase